MKPWLKELWTEPPLDKACVQAWCSFTFPLGFQVMAELDTIRKQRKKFICLNDNIEHDKEGAEVVREDDIMFISCFVETSLSCRWNKKDCLWSNMKMMRSYLANSLIRCSSHPLPLRMTGASISSRNVSMINLLSWSWTLSCYTISCT